MSKTRPSLNAEQAKRFLSLVMPAFLSALPQWEEWLMPPISDAIDERIAQGDLPAKLAEAFDDLGQFCQRVASDIFQARQQQGGAGRSAKRRTGSSPAVSGGRKARASKASG